MNTLHLTRQEAGQKSIEDLSEALDADLEAGLSTEQAQQRLDSVGRNELREKQARGPLQILIEQFKTIIIWLLLVAGVAALLIGETVEGIAVFAVIGVNAAIGFFTELRAVRSMQALRDLRVAEAAVLRDGQVRRMQTSELVPGDIVQLDSGDVVPADLRLVEANRLQVDEAALTGEAEPVTKQAVSLEEDVALAEQHNMMFKGTAITRGSGKGIIVATGMGTELGHILELVEEAEEEKTPLEERLDALGHRLVWLTLAVAALVMISGVIAGREWLLMAEIGIALAIASVPEGLPITATIALARGMKRMADRNALVTRLATVETLGSTNIICTDKTGTLTEGRMSVQFYQFEEDTIEVQGEVLSSEGDFKKAGDSIHPQTHSLLAEALKVGVLCSNASITYVDGAEGANGEEDTDGEHADGGGAPEVVGTPLEVALQVAGLKAGLPRDKLLAEYPEAREEAFDPQTRMMATIHECDSDGFWVAVKGAPEAVLEACTQIQTDGGVREINEQDQEAWAQRNEQAAKDGLRVLGLAHKRTGSSADNPYEALTFLGVVALLDPPRQDVKPMIDTCREAGIRLVMVTGDQELTARRVGTVLGIGEQDGDIVVHGSELQQHTGSEKNPDQYQRIIESNILVRVTPEQKLNLIDMHQQNRNVVAMTGDGVNDAPALKKADIGVAMGSGTQVAKDAADMILRDDNFRTIIFAIQHGRIIFNNLRTFMIYLFSSNVSTILTVGAASILTAPLPLLPLQILFLNVVVDVFPALALGMGDGSSEVMHQSPRKADSSILERRQWRSIGVYGLLIAVSVLLAFFLAHRWLGLSGNAAVTISFLTLMLTKLWHVFNMRSRNEGLVVNAITRNVYIWGALAICIVLIGAAVYLPGLAGVLQVVPPDARGWALALGASLLPLAIGQWLKSTGVVE